VKALRTKSGAELLELRKRRMAASPPVLRGGYRPFFLAAGLWAAAAILIWMLALEGLVDLPKGIAPLVWHRHEMLFGFGGAAVAGFLLTAIPNWTGRLPIAGGPLAALVGLWVAARLALLLLPPGTFPLFAGLDVGLSLVLAAVAAREVLQAGTRNLPIVLRVLLLAVADTLDYFVIAGRIADDLLGVRAGFSIILLMISVIGGRIIPSFTRNWLVKRGSTGALPGQPGRFDLAVIAVTALALAAWIARPTAAFTGGALVAAALLHAIRLLSWRGWSTFSYPLLLVLHLGYLWVPVGLTLLGLSMVTDAVPRSAALHALGAGAIATMILAVTTRASLGHTGRELRAASSTIGAYILLTLAALTRVATAFGWIDAMTGLRLAAAFWVGAFLLFVRVYGPILWKARVGE
jgi:uncharacterized protein involved in response to NO